MNQTTNRDQKLTPETQPTGLLRTNGENKHLNEMLELACSSLTLAAIGKTNKARAIYLLTPNSYLTITVAEPDKLGRITEVKADPNAEIFPKD